MKNFLAGDDGDQNYGDHPNSDHMDARQGEYASMEALEASQMGPTMSNTRSSIHLHPSLSITQLRKSPIAIIFTLITISAQRRQQCAPRGASTSTRGGTSRLRWGHYGRLLFHDLVQCAGRQEGGRGGGDAEKEEEEREGEEAQR